MMEWALAILFGAAALLLVLSFFKTRHSSKVEQQKIDMIHISVMEEINRLQEQIRNVELDGEIIAKEAGIQEIPNKERLLLRELLDLYKRGYNIEGIAAKKQLSENQVEHSLAPYISSKDKRRKVANGF
jgi:hypothetical protein